MLTCIFLLLLLSMPSPLLLYFLLAVAGDVVFQLENMQSTSVNAIVTDISSLSVLGNTQMYLASAAINNLDATLSTSIQQQINALATSSSNQMAQLSSSITATTASLATSASVQAAAAQASSLSIARDELSAAQYILQLSMATVAQSTSAAAVQLRIDASAAAMTAFLGATSAAETYTNSQINTIMSEVTTAVSNTHGLSFALAANTATTLSSLTSVARLALTTAASAAASAESVASIQINNVQASLQSTLSQQVSGTAAAIAQLRLDTSNEINSAISDYNNSVVTPLSQVNA